MSHAQENDGSKKTFSFIERWAIWLAHGKVCRLTGDPLNFEDMHVDHIVPEHLGRKPTELHAVLASYGLPPNFAINSYENWIPAHHRRNIEKGAASLTPEFARWLLEIAARKASAARAHHARLLALDDNVGLLERLGAAIDERRIAKEDVVAFLHGLPTTKRSVATVVAFGVTLRDALKSDRFPTDAPTSEPHVYEWLQEVLLTRLESTCPTRYCLVEDLRNGESFSVRVAIWSEDIDWIGDDLWTAAGNWWTVLEVADFEAVYSEDPASFFARRVSI